MPRRRPTTPADTVEEALQPIRDLIVLVMEAETPEASLEAEHLVRLAARRWAAALTSGNTYNNPDDTASTVAQSLGQLLIVAAGVRKILAGKAVSNADTADFWRTQIGQLIFGNDGFPARAATRLEAAAVLGISRQAVEQMCGTGTLESEDGTRVSRRSLCKEWERRELLERWAEVHREEEEK